MRKRQHLAFVLVTLLYLAHQGTSVGSAESMGMTHRRWSLEDGMPDQMILSMAQTPDGYLWLGTPHGLVRFDGFQFTNVAVGGAPTLEEFGALCVLVARDGTVWTGSVGGGVTHLSGSNARHYGLEQGFRTLSIRTLFQSSNGVIWAGTDRGLYRLSGNRFEFVDEFGERWITAIVSDGGDGFWIAGDQLIHFTQGRFQAVKIPRMKLPIRALARGTDGTLWIGAYHALLARTADGKLRSIWDHADIRTLQVDSAGNLWIGTIGSGVLRRGRDGRIAQALSPTESGAKAVRAIIQTRNGDEWLGTQEGLIRLSLTGMDFVRIRDTAGADYSSVMLDQDGSVWLSAGSLTRFAHDRAKPVVLPQLAKTTVRCTFRGRDGALWVGTLGDGVFRVVRGSIDLHSVSDRGSNAVTGFAEAPDGSIWIGTDDGVVRWAHRRFTRFTGASQFPQGVGTVRSMVFAPDESIWIATPSGLYRFKDGLFRRPQDAERLARFGIRSLFVDQVGYLWIGAGSGLYRWRDGSLSHIELPHSASESQAVVSILLDAKGRFLFATPTTLFRISREDIDRSLQAARIRTADGITEVVLSKEPETFAVARETGAELYSVLPQLGVADAVGGAYYATSLGLIRVLPDSLARQESAPPIVIERVMVDGVGVVTGVPVVLQASVHSIQIQASPILLSARAGLQFRRRLIGLEDDWTALVPGSPSTYGRLAPGTYRFRAEAQWPGSSDISSAEMVIVQQAPFYRRKSFLAATCLMLAVFAWLVHRARLRQVELRFQAVAAERNRVACEIHDTLLQGCIGAASLLEAIEISHDQTSPQTSDAQRQRWRSLLAYLREQMTESIKESREAIWNLRNADDLKPLDEALREVLDKLTSRADVSTSVHFTQNSVALTARAQHAILMAVREATLNALSHGRPSFINFDVSTDAHCLHIRIADDGLGFDVAAAMACDSGHFGLTGMLDRMRRFGGSMTIESSPGHGTLIHFHMPLSPTVLRQGRFHQ